MSAGRRALRAIVKRALIAYGRAARPRGEETVFIVIVSAWGMGGTIRAALNLAGHLARSRDVEVISVLRRREQPFFGRFPEGVRVTALDDGRRGAPEPRGRLHRLLRSRRSVLMHPRDRTFGSCSLWTDVQLVRRLRGRRGHLITTRPGLNLIAADLALPGLVTIGQEQMHLRSHAEPLRAAMARLYPRLDALAVLTERDSEEYAAMLDGVAPRLVRIPNTVRALGGPPADLSLRRVLAAGRLTPQKGFDLLIAAWAQVAAAHPGWRLRICGTGQQRRELRRLVAADGLENSVELPGAGDMAEEMAAASVFVLSSRYEGFPLILLEAMSKAMGVVAFDCPTGPADIVEDHRNGLLIPHLDVEALAAGIAELIEDESLRHRCATAAAETAREYTMEAVGPRWDQLLAELAQP